MVQYWAKWHSFCGEAITNGRPFSNLCYSLLCSLVVFLFSPLCLLPCLSPPDDHSRVILQPIEDDPSSDYINANYIDVSGNASNATIGSQRNQRNHTPSLVCQASIPLSPIQVVHPPFLKFNPSHQDIARRLCHSCVRFYIFQSANHNRFIAHFRNSFIQVPNALYHPTSNIPTKINHAFYHLLSNIQHIF